MPEGLPRGDVEASISPVHSTTQIPFKTASKQSEKLQERAPESNVL